MQHLSLSVDAEGIALITLNHATESVNLVTPEWTEQMRQAISRVAADDSIKGAVITSGKSIFMAGADLKIMVSAYGTMTPAEAYAFSLQASRMHRELETCGKPFVAAINGSALGGGYELALACHRRIMVDDPRVRVGLPEVTVGLLPGSGGTQRLPRMIGVEAALPLLIEGTAVDPKDALARGLVDSIVPSGDLIAAAKSWVQANPQAVQPWDKKGFTLPESDGLLKPSTAALISTWTARIAAKTRHNYPAPIAILTAVSEGVQVTFDKATLVEARQFAALLTTPVARNIIRTSFIARGEARRLKHRPDGVPKATVKKLGVLGAGLMGGGIAYCAAQAGIEVVLLDSSVALAEAGLAKLSVIAQRQVRRGQMTEQAAAELLSRIAPTADYRDLAGCTLVIEAVFEDRRIKAAVTKSAESVIGADAIFATNTSTLPITGLAEASRRPENFIGLHLFSPVERMELVEVICGRKTSPMTLARALDFVQQIRKTPIVVNDSRGFYTSRVFQTFIFEGASMLLEGISPARIENAAKSVGLPVGPLAVLDETSLELPLKIVDESIAEVPGYNAPGGVSVLRKMCALGRSGRKAAGGFYEYPDNAPKHLWSGLAGVFPTASGGTVGDVLGERFLIIQALESARCLQEGVLTRVADADLGSLLGWNYPAWTGGTLSYIDTIGIDQFAARCEDLAMRVGPRFAPGAALNRIDYGRT